MTKTTNKVKLGKKVYGVTRAGQKPNEDLAGRIGTIIDYTEKEIVGNINKQYWVRWENGHKEPFNSEQFKNAANFNGIGIYIK